MADDDTQPLFALRKEHIVGLCRNDRLSEARDQCAQLCRADPSDEHAWLLRAAIHALLGEFVATEICSRKAIALNSGIARAHYSLGHALMHQLRFGEAECSFRHAISLKHNYPEAHCELGSVLNSQGRYDEAEACFRKSIDSKPDYWIAHVCLANLLYKLGHMGLAIGEYQRAYTITPTYGLAIRIGTALPAIMESNIHIERVRTNLEKNLTTLLQTDGRLSDPVTEIGFANFYMTYHGKNNRDLQVKFAQLYSKACPELLYVAPHCRRNRYTSQNQRIKVGFISKFLKNHSIGKTTRGLIAMLDKQRFHVIAFFIGPQSDAISTFIEENVEETIVLTEHLDTVRKTIAKCELDILFYQDIGMDPFTYFLAFSRLARVQCTSFGHPDTTGIPTVDYMVSTNYYEPDNCEQHYSEKLFCLRDVGSCAYYYRPKLPEDLKSRTYFGLPEKSHIYICPQTLFKIHPEFDIILGEILRKDAAGRVVLIEGAQKHLANLIRERIHRTIPDVSSRIDFLPHQTGTDFINLIAVSDVMLDTIHFSGQNTTHEGFSAGIPIVTLPGEFMRGRHTLGFYRRMGVMDCVASDPENYVHIAVRLGMNPAFNKYVREKIQAARQRIWEEIEVVREFERFFEEVLAKYSI